VIWNRYSSMRFINLTQNDVAASLMVHPITELPECLDNFLARDNWELRH
jgi:hypothetical protein